MYAHKFSCNPFGLGQQKKIKEAGFAIIGLGGTGGFMLENLLRMGAEHFIVFDHDRFELTNFNRQPLATDRSLDKLKTEAALERARDINPRVQMSVNSMFGPGSSLAGASILLDGSDNAATKLAASQLARKRGIPYVFCAASGTRGIVSVFKRHDFRKAFQISGSVASHSCAEILCPAAALAGTLAASQAVNCLVGKQFIRAPDAVFFDLFSKRLFWRAKLG
jgi:sulfur carrier protein ThiS adenylyltransferase